jgi:hypothetical protein
MLVKIIHNQNKAQFEQALQHPDMLAFLINFYYGPNIKTPPPLGKCEQDSIQWMLVKIIHNQNKAQFEQALQHPDMLAFLINFYYGPNIKTPPLVHGHSNHPLHERADTLAIQGATESEGEFDDDIPNCLRMTKTGERWIVWGKQVQRHIQSHFTACAWEDHKQGTYMRGFLSQENTAHTQSDCTLKTSWDWVVQCWILCLTPGLLLACTKSRSKRTTTPQRCGCSEQDIETLSHIQLV